MRLFLFPLVLVYLALIPGTLAISCTIEEQQSYLHKLHYEQWVIGTLLARVQENYSGPLNYFDLAQALLTLEASDFGTMLREGKRFAETILDSESDAAKEFYKFADYTDRASLLRHVGVTLLNLNRLEARCGGGRREVRSTNTNLQFEDVVSSFTKYKIHLRNLIRDL